MSRFTVYVSLLLLTPVTCRVVELSSLICLVPLSLIAYTAVVSQLAQSAGTLLAHDGQAGIPFFTLRCPSTCPASKLSNFLTEVSESDGCYQRGEESEIGV